MRDNPICRVCGVALVAGENVTQNQIDRSQYICRSCRKEYAKVYNILHPEKRVAQHAAYHTRHMDDAAYKESRKEKAATYYAAHKGHCKEWKHRTGRSQPMSKNRTCASFLGIHVSERVLSHVFKNVVRMPNGTPGYDFRCAQGYLIDVKSGCKRYTSSGTGYWMFNINKNKIAEYFLCLAFDNRNHLTPEHIWLIPADNVNDKTGVGISESTIDKWKDYALDITKVISCCDTMRGATQ